MRNIEWLYAAWKDYLFWQREERKTLKRINMLIKDISRSPFDGLGEPESLRHQYSGYWSRKIDKKHRITYKVTDDKILFIACKGHYEDR